MVSIFLLVFIGSQLALAVTHRTALIYVSLLTGALPLTLGAHGIPMETFGKMDINAIRLLGLWLAAFLVVLGSFNRIWKYIALFHVHLIFLIFCCVSLFWAPSLFYGLRMIAKLTAPFLFLLLVMVVISSSQQLKRMEHLILTGGVAAVLFAFLSKSLNLTDPGLGLTIPMTSPAVFSAYLVAVMMPVTVNLKYGNRKITMTLILFFATAILAAFTRITIAAMFVGCSILFFIMFRGLMRLIFPLAAVVGFLALFFFNSTFKNRMFFGADKITSSSLMNDPSILLDHVHGSGRFGAWKYVFKTFFDPSPLIGSGIGTTQNYYYSNSTALGAIHSEYVRLLAEVGVLGLICFVGAIGIYLLRLIWIYRNHSETDSGKYALAAIGGLTAYLIFMATDNAFDYVNAFGIYVFGLIAMSEKSRELEQVNAKSGLNRDTLSNDFLTPVIRTTKEVRIRRYPIVEIR